MASKCTRFGLCWILGGAVVLYFLLFPGDIRGLLAPIDQLVAALARPAGTALQLSHMVSPWFYATAIAAIICWTALRYREQPKKTGTTRKKARSKA